MIDAGLGRIWFGNDQTMLVDELMIAATAQIRGKDLQRRTNWLEMYNFQKTNKKKSTLKQSIEARRPPIAPGHPGDTVYREWHLRPLHRHSLDWRCGRWR